MFVNMKFEDLRGPTDSLDLTSAAGAETVSSFLPLNFLQVALN